MSKMIIGIGLLFIIALVITIASCSKTIVPILTQSCAASGCHGGSIAPNLTATNAYNSLKTGNYINLATPASSEVYLWLTGKESATMPLGAANNPSNINALMLAWITQGAKNN